jgi:hypothetical protein
MEKDFTKINVENHIKTIKRKNKANLFLIHLRQTTTNFILYLMPVLTALDPGLSNG